MKKLFTLLATIALLFTACCNTQKTTDTMSSLKQTDIDAAIKAIWAKHSQINPDLVERGVKCTAKLWTAQDGSAEDFIAFCGANYQCTEAERHQLFQTIQRNVEAIYGRYNQISIDLKMPLHVVGDAPYTDKNQKLASIAGQILSARLIETIREKEGAVYSIWAQGNMSRVSTEPITIQSVFPMKPELKEKVLGMIKNEFVDMESNISEVEFNKVKEFMVKSQTEALEENNSWLNGLAGFQFNGVDTFNNAIATINSITVADVQNFMKEFNKQGNYRVVILDPAE